MPVNTTGHDARRSALTPPRNPEELKKLILKLRWIGLESEAEQLCSDLAELAPEQIVAEPLCTD